MAALKPWVFVGFLAVYAQVVTCFAQTSPAAAVSQQQVNDSESLQWLDRIAKASRQLNYVGSISYQAGNKLETSRIAHRFVNGIEQEHLEVLDGSPREVIRHGQEIRGYLPELNTIIISRVGVPDAFPGHLRASGAQLLNSYEITFDETVDRVAGHEARKIIFKARDDLRYGYVMWAEEKSGLLLKVIMFNTQGVTLEQFACTDVVIGGEVTDAMLAPKVKPGSDWRKVVVAGEADKGVVKIKNPLPGFSLQLRVRQSGGGEHLLFGDGLTTISVFIEPLQDDKSSSPGEVFTENHSENVGNISVSGRILGGQRIIALGRVPVRAVEQLADTFELDDLAGLK